MLMPKLSFSWTIMTRKPSDHTVHIAGWMLFIGSALCYTASTFKSGDILGMGGSLLFLIACFVFLWPLISDRP